MGQKKLSGVEALLKKFVDYLIRDSVYYVTEKYITRRTQISNRNYRPQTSSEGLNRQKLFNWQFILIQPSELEIEDYIEDWFLTYETPDAIPNDKPDFNLVLMDFMDEFVSNYFVFEKPDTRKDVNLFMGYRPSHKHEGAKMQSQFFMNFLTVQPSREEIQNLVSYWLAIQDL